MSTRSPGEDRLDGSSSFYDDGKTFDYRKGQFARIDMGWDDVRHRRRLSLAPGSRMLLSTPRAIEVAIAGGRKPVPVTFDGKSIEVRL